jgi:hypothetical protein
MLRRRILDKAGLPYLSVGLDPSRRRRGDLHRNACPARAIAASMPP